MDIPGECLQTRHRTPSSSPLLWLEFLQNVPVESPEIVSDVFLFFCFFFFFTFSSMPSDHSHGKTEQHLYEAIL